MLFIGYILFVLFLFSFLYDFNFEITGLSSSRGYVWYLHSQFSKYSLPVRCDLLHRKVEYFVQHTQQCPPVSLVQCEVAFSSQSGACLCGRPPQCGAAASAADAAVSALRVDAGGALKHPETPGSIHQGTSTIKALAIRINVGVFIWKDDRKLHICLLCGLTAGMQVERLRQDRSHLSWRSEGGKKICVLVCSALWIKKKKKQKRKLHSGYIQGYLLTFPSLGNNIERNFRKTQVRTFLFFAVTRFASVAFLLAVRVCHSLRKLQMVIGDTGKKIF